MHALMGALLLAEQEVSDKKDLYPHWSELIIAALAFGILFFFMWKWVIPRLNKVLEARREKIQGDLEKAEQAKSEADLLLVDYRTQLAGAREESNRIIEEARKTAESMRREMEAKAAQDAQAILSRAEEEIRAERDRVLQELKTQVGELSLQLAGRVVGETLDTPRHRRLIDQYIDELSAMSSNGNADGSSSGGTGT